jgi:hypothetical protein
MASKDDELPAEVDQVLKSGNVLRESCRKFFVNGQVVVPAGGQIKVPTPRVG